MPGQTLFRVAACFNFLVGLLFLFGRSAASGLTQLDPATGTNELIANAAHDLGMIAVAQLRHEDSDGLSPLVAQRPRQQAGLVIHLLRGGLDAVACDLGN